MKLSAVYVQRGPVIVVIVEIEIVLVIVILVVVIIVVVIVTVAVVKLTTRYYNLQNTATRKERQRQAYHNKITTISRILQSRTEARK